MTVIAIVANAIVVPRLEELSLPVEIVIENNPVAVGRAIDAGIVIEVVKARVPTDFDSPIASLRIVVLNRLKNRNAAVLVNIPPSVPLNLIADDSNRIAVFEVDPTTAAERDLIVENIDVVRIVDLQSRIIGVVITINTQAFDPNIRSKKIELTADENVPRRLGANHGVVGEPAVQTTIALTTDIRDSIASLASQVIGSVENR